MKVEPASQEGLAVLVREEMVSVGESERPRPASMRILMAAGGTGGHIFPALAVAKELRERNRRQTELSQPHPMIEFLGTGRGMESRLIPVAGFRLRVVAARGLKGISGWRRLVNLLVLARSVVETALVLREFQPDVVVGLGGYLAGPALLEAALKDIPTLLIEPNVVPGFTNKLLAPLVRAAAVGFEQAAAFYGPKARVTGHAVRQAFYEVPPKKHVPPFTVLILGGSQGAKAINGCVVETVSLLSSRADLSVVHQTGERDHKAVRAAYEGRGISGDIYAFIENVPEAFARADLVVSRAGAATVGELAAAGKASLLIPFPGATDHHQFENAKVLERAGAARVIDQRELTPERLAREVLELLAHPESLVSMEKAAKSLARPGAAARIAELIERLALRRPLSAPGSDQAARDNGRWTTDH